MTAETRVVMWVTGTFVAAKVKGEPIASVTLVHLQIDCNNRVVACSALLQLICTMHLTCTSDPLLPKAANMHFAIRR